VDSWQKELRTKASQGIKIFLIGNKADLEDQRVISKEQGEKMKEDYGFDLFMETSAKTGFHAEDLFFQASKLLYEEHNKFQVQRIDSKENLGVKLLEKNEEENKEKKKSCCC
jgi:GTPase SAR1 family protein